MQAFRLVNGGLPDRVICFDHLPKDLTANISMKPPTGLPRHWTRWLQENGSVDTENKPVFYVLDYQMINQDRIAWQNIVSYVRKQVETNVRLMDRLEDMAKPMAQDSRSDLTLEPEDIAIIPLPKD